MRIGSILENQKIEKRIAITPEIAKKYISLGLEVSLSENYGVHLGIKDEEYTKHGVKIFKHDSEIINNMQYITYIPDIHYLTSAQHTNYRPDTAKLSLLIRVNPMHSGWRSRTPPVDQAY